MAWTGGSGTDATCRGARFARDGQNAVEGHEKPSSGKSAVSRGTGARPDAEGELPGSLAEFQRHEQGLSEASVLFLTLLYNA